MDAQSVQFLGPHLVGIRPVHVPEPEVGEVMIRAELTGVSPGTELRCLAGMQPGFVFPAIAGYSFVGTVIQSRGALAEGTRVYCGGTARCDAIRGWGGHISHAVRSSDSCSVVPEGVDWRAASLARLAAIAYRGFTLADKSGNPRVAVIGLGPIGQISARLFHLSGLSVVGFDLSKERADVLASHGVPSHAVTGDLTQAVVSRFEGGADVVVDATGAPGVLMSSLEALRMQPWDQQANSPQLVIQGSYPGEFSLDYQRAFEREVRIHIPRDSSQTDIDRVLVMMAEPDGLRVSDLIDEVVPVEQAPDTYAKLRENKGSALTYAFSWSASG